MLVITVNITYVLNDVLELVIVLSFLVTSYLEILKSREFKGVLGNIRELSQCACWKKSVYIVRQFQSEMKFKY